MLPDEHNQKAGLCLDVSAAADSEDAGFSLSVTFCPFVLGTVFVGVTKTTAPKYWSRQLYRSCREKRRTAIASATVKYTPA